MSLKLVGQGSLIYGNEASHTDWLVSLCCVIKSCRQLATLSAVETSVPRLDDWSEMKPFGVVELVERSIAKSTKETTGCSDRRMSVIDCCPQSPAVSTVGRPSKQA
ncbi:DNA-directed RNA polymerase subunit beta' [Trichinella pseudospiralis]